MGPLFCERRGTDGEAIVFFHGLAASGRYWRPAADRLEAPDRRLYLVDLLGFGRSVWPAVTYSLADHLAALDDWRSAACLAQEPLVLVGHSAGAVIALAWAAQAPHIIGAVLVALPVYQDPIEAQQRLARLSLLNRLTLTHVPFGRAACTVMCLTRPFWRLVAPLLLPRLPAEVARDAVLHTWRSLSGTLERGVFGARPQELGRKTRALPKLLVHGTHDQTVPVENVRALTACLAGTRLVEIPDGAHDLPLSHPDQLAQAIGAFLRDRGANSFAENRGS